MPKQPRVRRKCSSAPAGARFLRFLLGALGLLFLLGGPAALYLLWYRLGRDKPVDMVADYLPEPPDDLAPGIAGTLLDEQADMRDIIATLVDLAQRKIISITEETDRQISHGQSATSSTATKIGKLPVSCL